ncbi:hypothetical protein ABIC17_002916 [Sphingomonas sp. PvP056]|jgi:hypothetical protein
MVPKGPDTASRQPLASPLQSAYIAFTLYIVG